MVLRPVCSIHRLFALQAAWEYGIKEVEIALVELFILKGLLRILC